MSVDNGIPRAVASIPGQPQQADEALYERSGYRVLPSLNPLYTVNQVRWAAALGGPLAATCLLSLNANRLKEAGKATKILIGGALVTIAYFLLATMVPDSWPSSPMWILSFAIAGKVAEAMQGEKLQKHSAAGGKRASNWGVAGYTLSAAVVCVVVILSSYFIMNISTFLPKTLRFGQNQIIYDEASRAEASALGQALIAENYFDDESVAGARLVRKPWGLQVNFYVRPLAPSERKEHRSYYANLSQALAIAMAQPIQVRLVLEDEEVEAAYYRTFPDRCVEAYPEGCYVLAPYYLYGVGVELDLEKYAALQKQACDGGHLEGCFAFADANYYGQGVAKDEAKFIRINQGACKEGGMLSCGALGEAYLRGFGTQPDLTLAEEYLMNACGGGVETSCELLAEFDEQPR